jgi:hypothetical protein
MKSMVDEVKKILGAKNSKKSKLKKLRVRKKKYDELDENTPADEPVPTEGGY